MPVDRKKEKWQSPLTATQNISASLHTNQHGLKEEKKILNPRSKRTSLLFQFCFFNFVRMIDTFDV